MHALLHVHQSFGKGDDTWELASEYVVTVAVTACYLDYCLIIMVAAFCTFTHTFTAALI